MRTWIVRYGISGIPGLSYMLVEAETPVEAVHLAALHFDPIHEPRIQCYQKYDVATQQEIPDPAHPWTRAGGYFINIEKEYIPPTVPTGRIVAAHYTN